MRQFRSLSAGVVGLCLVLSACSSGGGAPEALAFADAGGVNRPVGNPCAANEISVAFADDVVLVEANAGGFGPFDVSLPAGTYDVVMSSWLGAHEDPSQTNEQWFFTTDSGYVSPATVDSSPELLMNQAFQSQRIGESSSVTLHHRGASTADAQSTVHPLCVGFRLVEADGAVDATESDDSGVEVEPVQVSFVETESTVSSAPATDVGRVSHAAAGVIKSAKVSASGAGVLAQVDPANGDGTNADSGNAASSGSNNLAMSMALAGAAVVVAGSAATVATRRSQDS